MGRISPGRGGNDGNTANEGSPSSRSMRPLPVNDRQHHHQDPPVVPDNFEEHCDWIPVSRRSRRPRRNRRPLPENNDGQRHQDPPIVHERSDWVPVVSRSSTNQGSISRTNSSGTLISLNSQNRQTPVMPPHNHNIVQHRGPIPEDDQERHEDPPVVPQIIDDEHCDWVPVVSRSSANQGSGGIPPTTRSFRRSTTYQERTSTTSTGNSFPSLQLPSGQHQRQVPRNSQVSNHDLQFHNGIIPRNSVVGNENHRRRTRRRRRPRDHVGVLILASENSQVIQLPVVVFHADDPTAQQHHSSDQRTTHFHDYNDNHRGRFRRSHHHSYSDEHQYIIHQDSHIHLSMDDGFDNIMDDHQHDIIEEQIYGVTSGLSEESILEHLNARTLIKESITTSPTTDPCSSTSTTDNEICTICQDHFEENNIITTLDCGHKFHLDCIKKWLLINNQCPLCKRTCLTLD